MHKTLQNIAIKDVSSHLLDSCYQLSSRPANPVKLLMIYMNGTRDRNWWEGLKSLLLMGEHPEISDWWPPPSVFIPQPLNRTRHWSMFMSFSLAESWHWTTVFLLDSVRFSHSAATYSQSVFISGREHRVEMFRQFLVGRVKETKHKGFWQLTQSLLESSSPP